MFFLKRKDRVGRSFTKNKTPAHVFFSQLAIELVVAYGKTRYSYKIDSSCCLPSTD